MAVVRASSRGERRSTLFAGPMQRYSGGGIANATEWACRTSNILWQKSGLHSTDRTARTLTLAVAM